MAKKDGLFISFEGGEGVGKTTLISTLSEELEKKGFSVVKTFEPGGTSLGTNLRQCLLDQQLMIHKKAELFLFLADRAQHVEEVILPALKKGKIVLCDRYNDSTIAYQGIARSFDLQNLLRLCEFSTDGLNPELTFYLDLDPKEGLRRILELRKSTKQFDRIEKEDLVFHEKVRDAFLSIALREKERIVVLDASLPKEEVFKQAIDRILDKL